MVCLGLAVLGSAMTSRSASSKTGAPAYDQEPNEPIGIAKGANSGRVTWMHDASVTSWAYAGDNPIWDGMDSGGHGYWYEDGNTDPQAAARMMALSVRALAGEESDAAAWDRLFRHHNIVRGKGDTGYQPGEQIMIKPNLFMCIAAGGAVDATGEQVEKLGLIQTSPQMLLALVEQLVTVVGVQQSDITIGDSTAVIPNHYLNYFAAFSGIRFLSREGGPPRVIAQPSQNRIYWSEPDPGLIQGTEPDFVPSSYANAEYLINFACLKSHRAGITVCAKNHYGSFIRRPYPEGNFYNLHHSLPSGWSNPGTGRYRTLVDITGHPDLGGKTVLYLIDAMYAGYFAMSRPLRWHSPPFGASINGDWPSSLFASQDPVAIDSVAHDFLAMEWPDAVSGGVGNPGSLDGGAEDYLHEAALADAPPSGVSYDPAGTQMGLESLGVHEHWNNSVDKQYSRNLGLGDGIDLVEVHVLLEDGFELGDTTAWSSRSSR